MAKDEDGANDGQERRLVKGAAVLNPHPVLQDSHNRVEEAPNVEQIDNEVEHHVQDLLLGGNLDGIERQAFAYVSNARMKGLKDSTHYQRDETPPGTDTGEVTLDPRNHKMRRKAEHRSGMDDERRQQTEERIEAIEKELAKDSFNVATAIKEMVDDQTPGMLMHCARLY